MDAAEHARTGSPVSARPVVSNVNAAPPAVLLMGPTASGKTDVAVELAERLPVDIISVDSAMVYREMDIGTAKPDAATLTRAPHRLIDIRDPAESYSAGDFLRDARQAMADITAAGRVPLLVGGTMLYFRAIQRGLAELPTADPEFRKALDKRAVRVGWETLHAELAAVDPTAAARIHPNDPQRIQRALEVYHATGSRLSQLQSDAVPAAADYRLIRLVLAPGRHDNLRSNIEVRFNSMIERGFLEEVRRLYERGDLHADLPSMRAVGYRQLWRHLAGGVILDTAVREAVTATRQLAKRQRTWLRTERKAIRFDALEPGVATHILKTVAREIPV